MILPDRMHAGAWIHDARLRRLPCHVQLLFIFLRHVCDRSGRFGYEPKLIHTALYASAECSNVSARDVEAWLEILRSGGFVKSYTGTDGRRVGEVAKDYWRQRLSFGKDQFEPEPDQPELGLAVPDPPDPPRRQSRREEKRGECGARGARARAHTHTEFPLAPPNPAAAVPDVEQRLHALRQAFPHVNIESELKAAEVYVRRQRGPGAQVDLEWFGRSWLPNCGVKYAGQRPPAVTVAEPPNWRAAARLVAHRTADEDLRERRLLAADENSWASIGGEFRREILEELKGAAAA